MKEKIALLMFLSLLLLSPAYAKKPEVKEKRPLAKITGVIQSINPGSFPIGDWDSGTNFTYAISRIKYIEQGKNLTARIFFPQEIPNFEKDDTVYVEYDTTTRYLSFLDIAKRYCTDEDGDINKKYALQKGGLSFDGVADSISLIEHTEEPNKLKFLKE